MIKILWQETDAKGYTDLIPLYLVADEGDRDNVYHEVLGPKGGRHSAKCSVRVANRIVILDYGGKYEQENDKLGFEAGKLKIEFLDNSRQIISSIWWKNEGHENYEKAPVSFCISKDGDFEDTRTVSEGSPLLVSHMRRERKPGLRAKKLQDVLSSGQPLRCEACGFDFDATYEHSAKAACEVHHRKPLAQGRQEVSPEDLAILCANCHRVIHRIEPMPSVEEFAKNFRRAKGTSN